MKKIAILNFKGGTGKTTTAGQSLTDQRLNVKIIGFSPGIAGRSSLLLEQTAILVLSTRLASAGIWPEIDF